MEDTTISLYKKISRSITVFENWLRKALSKYPIIYAAVAGVAIVFFWRGVWHTGDILEAQGGILSILFSGPGSLVTSLIVLLLIGVFVSAFVGDMFLLTGLKKEKKSVDKTETEVKQEEEHLQTVEQVIDDLYEEIDHVGDKQEILEKKIDEQSQLLKQLVEKK